MPQSAEDLVPVPESRAAFDFLSSYGRDLRIETSITRMGQRVRAIVPECIALSPGLVEEGLRFTLVAESREVALLDAIQYLDGGPCAAAAEHGEVNEATQSGQPRQTRQTRQTRQPTEQPAIDEAHWDLFARAQAVSGVASTLSLPMMTGVRVAVGVNLYASTPDAFDGHHDELADACGAWAHGVVTNADLSFTSRLRAAAAPARLRKRALLDSAAGFLASHQAIDVESATARIRQAATRAGVRENDVARLILDSNAAPGT